MQAFREWLRASLKERGWTNSDLERASGVSNSIIWRWQTDPPRRPTPANLRKIAAPLGISYEDLMKLCGYLPGPDSGKRSDPRLAHIEARWPQLNEGLKEAILRITGPSRALEVAM